MPLHLNRNQMDLAAARQEMDDRITNVRKAIEHWTEKVTFHTMRGHKTAREDAEVTLQGNKDLLIQLLAEKSHHPAFPVHLDRPYVEVKESTPQPVQTPVPVVESSSTKTTTVKVASKKKSKAKKK